MMKLDEDEGWGQQRMERSVRTRRLTRTLLWLCMYSL
jgi:hypothetical protein